MPATAAAAAGPLQGRRRPAAAAAVVEESDGEETEEELEQGGEDEEVSSPAHPPESADFQFRTVCAFDPPPKFMLCFPFRAPLDRPCPLHGFLLCRLR